MKAAHIGNGERVGNQHALAIRPNVADGVPLEEIGAIWTNLQASGVDHILPVKHTVTGEDMNRRSATPALVTVLAAALTLSLAACGGSDTNTTKKKSSRPSTAAQARGIVSGATTFTPNPAAIAKLKAAGVVVTPTAPGTATATTIVLPAEGGRIVVKSLIGSIHSGAGLTFAKGPTKVTFENLAFNTESRKVTGSYKGNRIAVFQMKLKNLTTAKSKTGALVGSKIDLVYSRGAVAVVNKALNVTVMKTKNVFGTATFTVVAKKSGSTASKKKTKSKKKTSSTTTTTTTTSTK